MAAAPGEAAVQVAAERPASPGLQGRTVRCDTIVGAVLRYGLAIRIVLATAEARAANAEAKVSDAAAEIAFLKLTIKKLQREIYGQRSERKRRLLDQLELQLDELETSATEDELAAEKAAAETT